MTRARALVVGIDHYDRFSSLRCAVADAELISELLSRDDDGSLNYKTRVITSGPGKQCVSRALLRQQWVDLFDNFDGNVVFYFSGHGAQTPWGACLVTEEGTTDELGVPMEDLLLLANRSEARDVVIVLDCCHSGDLGNPPILQGLQRPLSLLREGVTILAASRPNEPAYESDGHGLFTGGSPRVSLAALPTT